MRGGPRNIAAANLDRAFCCRLPEPGGGDRAARSAARDSGSEYKHGGSVRSGGVLFVHRFGATLNAHVHLHLCMLDGVVAQGRQGLAFRGAQVDEACVQRVQAAVRQRVLELFERRGLLSRETVAGMQGWGHSGGFSVHAGERVAAQDRAGRERLVWAGGGRSAQQKWHMRRSVGRCGPCAGGVR